MRASDQGKNERFCSPYNYIEDGGSICCSGKFPTTEFLFLLLLRTLTFIIIPGYIFLRRSFTFLFVACGMPKHQGLNTPLVAHETNHGVDSIEVGELVLHRDLVAAALCNCSTDPAIIVVDPDTPLFHHYTGPL